MSVCLLGNEMTGYEKQVHNLKTMRWKIVDRIQVSGMRAVRWNVVTNIFVEVQTERWQTCLFCSWTPSHRLGVIFAHYCCLFFLRLLLDTLLRQRNTLNGEKMKNVPKQPEEDRVGDASCRTRIPLWSKLVFLSLFYWYDTNAKRLLLLCSVENTEHMLSLTWVFKSSTIQVNPQWDRIIYFFLCGLLLNCN